MNIREKLYISTRDLSKTLKSSRCVILMVLTTISFIVLMLSTSLAERAKYAVPTALLSYMCTFYMMNNCYILMVLLISQEGKNVFPMRFLSLLHICGIVIAVLQIISLLIVAIPDADMTKSTGPAYTTGIFCLAQIFAAGAYLAAEFKSRDQGEQPAKAESPAVDAASISEPGNAGNQALKEFTFGPKHESESGKYPSFIEEIQRMNRLQNTSTAGSDAVTGFHSEANGPDLEVFEPCVRRLEDIIAKVDLLNKRKDEAWRQGRNLKTAYETERNEYEKTMIQLSEAFEVRTPTSNACPERPREVFEFSHCNSEESADMARFGIEEPTALDLTNFYENRESPSVFENGDTGGRTSLPKESSHKTPKEVEAEMDLPDLEEIFEPSTKTLESIIRNVDLRIERMTEAWKRGKKLKAASEIKRGEFEKKMFECGTTFQVPTLTSNAFPEGPREILDFSACHSEESADVARCEDGDLMTGTKTTSYNNDTAWLTSEVMGLSSGLLNHDDIPVMAIEDSRFWD